MSRPLHDKAILVYPMGRPFHEVGRLIVPTRSQVISLQRNVGNLW